MEQVVSSPFVVVNKRNVTHFNSQEVSAHLSCPCLAGECPEVVLSGFRLR